MNRPFWYRIHSWVGLNIFIFLSFIFLTGTLAVFSLEIDWLLHPEMRVTDTPPGPRLSLGAVYDAAKAGYPDGAVMAIIDYHRPSFATNVQAETPWGETVQLWINPYTGGYQGATPYYSAKEIFRQLHSHLMIPKPLGLSVVTILSAVLGVLFVSSIFYYRNFWRGFWSVPRFHKPARVWLSELHRFIGVWSLWFIVIVGLTSAWYFLESIGLRAPYYWDHTPPAVARDVRLPDAFDGADLDQMIADAKRVQPALQVSDITFPYNTKKPIIVQGDGSATLVRPRANAVYFDPTTKQMLRSHRGEELSALIRVSEAMDPLHFGTFGGIPTRMIWLAFGAALTILSVAGVCIYAVRTKEKVAGSGAGRVWRGMWFSKWALVALVAAGIVLTVREPQHQTWISFGPQVLANGRTAVLETRGWYRPGKSIAYRVKLEGAPSDANPSEGGFSGGNLDALTFRKQGHHLIARGAVDVPREADSYAFTMHLVHPSGAREAVVWTVGQRVF